MDPASSVSALGIAWAIPFAGLLASIALAPLVAPRWWHAHFGKVALAWTVAIVAPMLVRFGVGHAAHELAHIALSEYLPFVLLLAALYVVTGGIEIRAPLSGSMPSNLAVLAFGTAIASWIGTTGASMLLIRPLLRANAWRPRRVHTVVFFILLVSNVGGALTPLGDPPLFLGFLQGVPFFWTAQALWWPTLLAAGALLACYAVVDAWMLRRDLRAAPRPVPIAVPASASGGPRFGLRGAANVGLLGVILGVVMLSGFWKSGVMLGSADLGVSLENAVRDGLLVAAIVSSWWLTPRGLRRASGFSLAPIEEVAILFAVIFITIAPVMQILAAGRAGPLGGVLDLVQPGGVAHPGAYFWITGLLSSVLDNAPTYLVFFEFAGGDAAALTGPQAPVLAAISAGAVYMGAYTYIGNAPNLMVRAIASEQGVAMPSFFGFIAWTAVLLTPVLLLMHLVTL